MLSIFSKPKSHIPSGYFPIRTDIHSHILPGIDDGAPDVSTSITLVKGLMEAGVTRSIATPHIISDLYPNNAESIHKALEKLKNELVKQQIDFEVSAAAEYMMDSYFLELLQKKVPLLTLSNNIILTEFPFAFMPDHVEDISFAIFTEGYQPILAHPERYGYTHGNYKVYHRWAEIGFHLQLNLLSLTGYYGNEVAKAARYLLKHDLVSYVGTDMHHGRHLEVLKSPESIKIFHEYLGGREWNIAFNQN
ncbi:MAG TPA: histidinol phosphatase [Ferruginibacter sp.]|nr:histidinol phosphatase [Ferruginibacter sp.]HRO05250.1 histidinol phosphatase [Ferruginibacter sp.]HRO96012.1 histidinol phosphatase [Ferruginibacter sp.]HRP48654.1 histidinol phosphatase [Ferruginibacter sp.]